MRWLSCLSYKYHNLQPSWGAYRSIYSFLWNICPRTYLSPKATRQHYNTFHCYIHSVNWPTRQSMSLLCWIVILHTVMCYPKSAENDIFWTKKGWKGIITGQRGTKFEIIISPDHVFHKNILDNLFSLKCFWQLFVLAHFSVKVSRRFCCAEYMLCARNFT